MKKRIYIDTSIVGGYFDREFREATIQLFDRLARNELIFIVSDLVELELTNAPERVRNHLLRYSPESIHRIVLTEEAFRLADRYISEGVVGKSSLEDCRHVAAATLHDVYCLASWNFKHMVGSNRIDGYNSVNLRLGYPMLTIKSPLELI